jgi:AraC-like DNA-binding protein
MTDDATQLPLNANREPMVLVGAVKATFELALSLGLERGRLLARLGLQEGDLDDPDAKVPLEAHTALWEALAELPSADTLALKLAEGGSNPVSGVLAWLVTHAPTARDMLESIRRYRAFFGDPYIPEIEDYDDCLVVHRVFEPRIARTRIMPEFAPASTVALIRRLTQLPGSAPLALDVWFQHEAPPSRAAHDAFFGCRVRFGAPETRLVLARAAVDRKVVGRDPELYAYLDRHARSLVETFRESDSLSARVREALAEALTRGEPSQLEIARGLAMSERTLQRRLSSEGGSFAALLDGVRQELAKRYLDDPNLAVSEVTFMLGYAEPSSFHRAFKRWTGKSPQEFRRQRAR